jgi:hypothetical protein
VGAVVLTLGVGDMGYVLGGLAVGAPMAAAHAEKLAFCDCDWLCLVGVRAEAFWDGVVDLVWLPGQNLSAAFAANFTASIL